MTLETINRQPRDQLRRQRLLSGVVWAGRAAIAFGILAAWEWLPSVALLRERYTFLDPFFISSPTRATHKIWDLMTGKNDTQTFWSALNETLVAAAIGTGLSIVVGFVLGLLLSNWRTLNRIVRPYLFFANSVPRIAIIPIIILVVGDPRQSGIVTAFTVIVFLVFFNAFEGGSHVSQGVIQNAQLLGANGWTILIRVRCPYALAWTMASLPNAISFGLIGTVTAEIFTGGHGIGGIMVAAVSTANSDLTMAVVLVLSVIGVTAVICVEALRARLVPWWTRS